MPNYCTHQLDRAPACPSQIDTTTTTASTLDRAADLALFFGRSAYAERLAHRAAELREVAP